MVLKVEMVTNFFYTKRNILGNDKIFMNVRNLLIYDLITDLYQEKFHAFSSSYLRNSISTYLSKNRQNKKRYQNTLVNFYELIPFNIKLIYVVILIHNLWI